VHSSVTAYRAPQQLPQATRLHQARHLLRDARLRATRAGASTDAPRPALTPEQRAELVILQTFFGSEVIKIAGGGRPVLDTDAITARITRDLMLSIVRVAGQVVYEYRATNAIHSYNEDAANFTLNSPDLWTYTPDKTVLRVPSQIVTPLSNVLDQGGVIGADLQIPKAIMVRALDDVGATGALWFVVGDKGEVEASSFPTDVPIFDPLSQSTYTESREEFGGQIREHVWGTKPGTPPRTWVGGNDVVGY